MHTTFEFECDCENPTHEASCDFRKGYVHIHNPDGSTEERSNELYLSVSEKGVERVEIMIHPDMARAMMWWMICMYMPVVSHAIKLWKHARMKFYRFRA